MDIAPPPPSTHTHHCLSLITAENGTQDTPYRPPSFPRCLRLTRRGRHKVGHRTLTRTEDGHETTPIPSPPPPPLRLIRRGRHKAGHRTVSVQLFQSNQDRKRDTRQPSYPPLHPLSVLLEERDIDTNNNRRYTSTPPPPHPPKQVSRSDPGKTWDPHPLHTHTSRVSGELDKGRTRDQEAILLSQSRHVND